MVFQQSTRVGQPQRRYPGIGRIVPITVLRRQRLSTHPSHDASCAIVGGVGGCPVAARQHRGVRTAVPESADPRGRAFRGRAGVMPVAMPGHGLELIRKATSVLQRGLYWSPNPVTEGPVMPQEQAPRLSHVGLYVTDVPKMTDFYTSVLGFVVSDRAEDGRVTF